MHLVKFAVSISLASLCFWIGWDAWADKEYWWAGSLWVLACLNLGGIYR